MAPDAYYQLVLAVGWRGWMPLTAQVWVSHGAREDGANRTADGGTMHHQPNELSVISFPTHKTPNPIKRHKPILVRKPIWRLRRKMTGSAARTRSEMTERTEKRLWSENGEPLHGFTAGRVKTYCLAQGQWIRPDASTDTLRRPPHPNML